MIKQHIDVFLAKPVHYKSYVFLRVFVAMATLLTFLFNDIDLLFPSICNNSENFYSKLILKGFNVSNYIIGIKLWYVILSILVLISVIAGFYPRITGILHFIVSYTFFKTCPLVDGGDQLCSNLSLLLIPMTLFDSNKSHWRPHPENFKKLVSKTFFLQFEFFIMLQICTVYLHSSIGKFDVVEWMDATAIWYWFNHEVFGANYFILDALQVLLRYEWIIYTISWSIILLEIMIAMMLFVPKNSPLALSVFYSGIILHVGIVLIHGLFSFSLVMIGCLLFYFHKPENKHYESQRI